MESSPLTSIPDPTEFTPDPLMQQLAELFERGKNGAGWFYWVAALSLINSVMMLSGSDFGFALGLSVTMIADVVALDVAKQPDVGVMPYAVAIVFDLVVLSMVVLCGWLSQKRILIVFALGMALYVLDGLLCLLFMQFVGVAIHAFAVFSMWNGFMAYRQLNQLERQLSSVPSIEPAPFAG